MQPEVEVQDVRDIFRRYGLDGGSVPVLARLVLSTD